MQIRFKTALAAAALIVGAVGASRANAATIVLNLTGTVADGTFNTSMGGGGSTVHTYVLDLGLGSSVPFTVSQGDEIQATVTLDTPLTIPSSLPGGLQFVGLNFSNTDGSDPGTSSNNNTISGYDIFSGGTGISTDQMGTNCGNCLSALFGQAGDTFSFSGLFADSTMNQLDTSYLVNDVTLSYQVNAFPSAVSEPATWAMLLLGFGAVGLMMRGARRRGAAATSWS